MNRDRGRNICSQTIGDFGLSQAGIDHSILKVWMGDVDIDRRVDHIGSLNLSVGIRRNVNKLNIKTVPPAADRFWIVNIIAKFHLIVRI